MRDRHTLHIRPLKITADVFSVLVLGFLTGICDLSRWLSTEYDPVEHIRVRINTSDC